MKRVLHIPLTLLCLFVYSVTSARADDGTLTLDQAYELALAQSESLQRKIEDIRIAEAQYKEAIAALYPNIRAGATQRFRNSQSAGGNPSTGDVNNSPSTFRAFSKHPFETAITVRQPIFTGFREYYIAEAVEGEVRALNFEQKRNKQLLFEDVGDVFNQIIYYSEDLKILKKTEGVFAQRIQELRQFIQLGKSRDSEIAAAQSDLARLGASEARVSGLLGASKEVLAFLTGRNADTLKLKSDTGISNIPTLEESLARAAERDDILANKERIESANKQVIAAQRERWPNLSVDGNYYPYEDPDTDRDWEVIFRFNVPLYEGGAIDARVEQSRAKARSSALLAQESRRAAERDVRISYNNVTTAQAEVKRLENLVSATRRDYDAQHRDYESGVVNNLDVLSAIRDMQEAERQLLNSQTNLRTSIIKLRVASGEIQ